MIRALIFDLDETLIDRHETMRVFLVEQYKRFPALECCDAATFANTCLTFQKNGYADKLEAFTNACSALAIRDPQLPIALFADFKQQYGTQAIAFDGAQTVINVLSKKFLLGLVTNGRTVGQYAKLDSVGLTSFFSAIVVSEAQGVKKPDPSIFQACLEALDLSAEEAIFIGDNPSADIAPAKRLGMQTIWMRNDYFEAPDHCDAIADNVRALLSVISQMTGEKATPSFLNRD